MSSTDVVFDDDFESHLNFLKLFKTFWIKYCGSSSRPIAAIIGF